MARSFDGFNDAGGLALNLSATNVLTLSFWLLWDAFANDDDLAFEFTGNYNGFSGGFIVDPNAADGTFQVGLLGDVGYCIVSFARPSAAVWHQYGIVLNKGAATNEVGPVYVDGVVQSLTYNSNSNNTNTFANADLNIMCRNGSALFGAGDLAELAIWTAALSAGELVALGRGSSPLLIRSPLSYNPLYGLSAPEIDLTGNAHPVSITGATLANHAPAVRPVLTQNSADQTPGSGPPPAGSTVTASGTTVTITTTGTVTIRDSLNNVVYSGGSAQIILPEGSYTWTDTLAGSGSFAVSSGDRQRMGGSGAIRKPPRTGR